ncbi:MAG: N-acetyl-gamma-glutamyl-phosphate reductase [Anaerolineaceae bacterium]|nr:N-acetyl-gamma-glutamyl-phosphate reductase [Anaerolineaceae bacterium]
MAKAQDKLRVGILGATGYAAAELMRILLRHRGVEITALGALAEECGPLETIYPEFAGRLGLDVQPHDGRSLGAKCDLAFCALPHAVSFEFVPGLLAAGIKVIDFSADYRLKGDGLYEKWYGRKPDAENLAHAVYGLPELYRDQIKKASLVANPGCYPTSVILGLAPLVDKGLIRPDRIIANSASGTSGAGRSVTQAMLFCEVNEGLKAYAATGHRHQPEMAEQLSRIGRVDFDVHFQPHLVPMDRGILSTIYTWPMREVTQDEVTGLYHEMYDAEPFVVVRDEPPSTKHVLGTNYVHLYPLVTRGKIVVYSAIDNLTKGAAGQAVQNMNLVCGFDETEALL